MKKRLSLIITIIFCLNIAFSSMMPVKAITYSLFDGYGTEKHPFLLKTATDIMNLSTSVNNGETYKGSYFVLLNDINMSGKSFRPIGEGSNSFEGVFDGNLKTISNVSVSGIGSGKYLGFFGTVKGGTVKNLKISTITISFANTYTDSKVLGVGGLAGKVTGGSVLRSGVKDVSITNSATYSEIAPGGFLGVVSSATISDCYSINFTWNGSTSAMLGGFIGNVSNNSDKVTVKNCYCAGSFIRNKTPFALFAMGKVEKNSNLTKSNNYVSHGVEKDMYSSGLTNADIAATVVSNSTMQGYASNLGSEFVSDTNSSNGGYPKCSADASSLEKIQGAIDDFQKVFYEEDKENGAITTNLDLTTKGLYGTVVSWTSANTSVITNAGVIADVYDTTYTTLTATFALGGNTKSNTYKIKVGASDTAKVKKDINSISLASTVTEDFGLPTTGSIYGSEISWTSSNTSYISIDGNIATVTRPTSATGDVTVTLTAKGIYNESNYSKTFSVKVSKSSDDSSAVSTAKSNLTFATLSSEDASAVTKNLYLPKTFGDNVTVTWSASPSVITTDGVVIRSTTGDQAVTLTATLKKGSTTQTKTFSLTLKQITDSSEKLQNIADNLTFDKLSSQSIDEVTSNLSLPSSFGGATVKWTSSKTGVISNSGTVTRPAFCSNNETVKLTAALTLDGKTVNKYFYVTVLESDGNVYYLNETFNSFSTGALPDDNTHFKLYGNRIGVNIAANPVGGGNSLYLYKNSEMAAADNNNTLRITSDLSKGKIIFESNIYINSLPEDKFRIAGYTNIGTEVTVWFTGSTVSCGDSSRNITAKAWHTIKIVVDTENKNYTGYIDSQQINSTPVSFAYVSDNSAERSLSRFSCDIAYGVVNSTHSVYLDNIKIYQAASYGSIMSKLIDKAELSLFKVQSIDGITGNLDLPDGVEFASGNTEVLSDEGELLQKNKNVSFYLTSRQGVDPYSATSYTKEYTAKTDYFLSGDGTSESPYLIENATQLMAFAKEVNEGNNYSENYLKLTNDIDLSEFSWTPIGSGTNTFAGVFDGNCHTISNISMTTITDGKSAGLFGNLSGTLSNLGINGITINVVNRGDNAKINYAGGLVGDLKSTGRIDRCFVKDFSLTNTSTTNKILYSGGLVGYLESSAEPSVSNSYVLNFTYNTAVSDDTSYVAGLFGYIQSSQTKVINVANCYTAGTFTANNLNIYPAGAVATVAYAKSNSIYAAHGVSASSTERRDIADSHSSHTNCGYLSAEEMRAASLLGDAFQADVDMLNGGFPMLSWENTDSKIKKFICTGIIKENGVVTGVNIEKFDNTSVNTKFIAAIFSGNALKKVIEIKYINNFVKGANTVEIDSSRVVADNETVKVFIWASDTMKPLMFAFEK